MARSSQCDPPAVSAYWPPALLDFVLARPIASAGMIAKELGVTPRVGLWTVLREPPWKDADAPFLSTKGAGYRRKRISHKRTSGIFQK
jgi:hypothetical protein